jgi:lactoylglutathione lyase
MELAKPHVDIGLFTNQRDEALEFWQRDVGLEFDHLAKLGGGVHQLRHHVNGSILKVNHARAPLDNDAKAGWSELLIARDDIESRHELMDPDGNRVSIVPRGYQGIEGIGIRVAAFRHAACRVFYRDVLGATELDDDRLMMGDTILLLEPSAPRPMPIYRALGFRYITVQIFSCDREHERIIRAGGIEGRAPRTIGTTTRYSFVRDPDGNWIEVSQRAELVGNLD